MLNLKSYPPFSPEFVKWEDPGPESGIDIPSLPPHISSPGWKKFEKSNSEGKKSSE